MGPAVLIKDIPLTLDTLATGADIVIDGGLTTSRAARPMER
jgi:hypothetical protein